MLVTYEQCMNAWGSVYFLPHLTVLFMVVFSETVGRSAAAANVRRRRERGQGGVKACAFEHRASCRSVDEIIR